MQFPDNYPQQFYQDNSAYILTDAVFGGLGLVPSSIKTPSDKINPSGEHIDVEKVRNPHKAINFMLVSTRIKNALQGMSFIIKVFI